MTMNKLKMQSEIIDYTLNSLILFLPCSRFNSLPTNKNLIMELSMKLHLQFIASTRIKVRYVTMCSIAIKMWCYSLAAGKNVVNLNLMLIIVLLLVSKYIVLSRHRGCG